ncbi:MAG TPA: S8 family serine peptidase, partial [Nocardioidaceae bacterium]|nr:S8 family serine peptidase [Nocardioidaceae bacterium]
ALAALPDVFWIDLEGRKVLRNDNTVWVGQSGVSGDQSTPIFDHGIFGQGQTVAVLDSGIDADACWFRDPGRGLPPTNVCNGGTTVDTSRRKVIAVDFLDAGECANGITSSEWDTHGHGTHVAGTLTGDDIAPPLIHDPADGMAPGAQLVVQDGGARTDNCADIPALGCPVIDLNPIFQQTYDQGARIHSDSWGDDENNPSQNHYTAATQDVDEFMWRHKDFLIFIAAGNDGPRAASVGSPSTAKSCVSVGATEPAGFAEAMASFSSCGPTDDGRLKPDLTLPGLAIVSAFNDGNVAREDCASISMSGTSMATPAAAGFAALVRQYFTDGWYPSGAARAQDGFRPSAALVKAALLNSAVSMAQASPIPDACQGWGRVLLANALLFAGDSRHLWVADDAGFATGAAGASRSFTFDVGNGGGGAPLKATLVWTDFPSTPAASIQLVNDLDLTVTGPGGETWLGNVFARGLSATGGEADRRNTVEQVLLDHPASGRYTVTVQAANVPQGPQPFALVVTGEVT